MITKEKILDILYKYADDNFGINTTYIDNIDFEDLAEDLVKNCSIPDVVKSFGCGWNFCDAVLDKKGVVKCGKCNRYE